MNKPPERRTDKECALQFHVSQTGRKADTFTGIEIRLKFTKIRENEFEIKYLDLTKQ